MGDLLLGILDHCPFYHYIHYWCDFTPCLTWVDRHFSSYIHCFTIILVIACDSSRSLPPPPSPHFFSYTNIFQVWYLLHHSCVSHYQFDLLHHLIIDIIFTLSTFKSMVHEFFYTCCILYMRAGVFYHWVFGPSFPSFLLPYHPSLRYVPYLKTTLRPWDQILGHVFEIWLIFRYHHASSYGRRLFDVWIWFSYGFGLPGLHVWQGMIWCHLIF